MYICTYVYIYVQIPLNINTRLIIVQIEAPHYVILLFYFCLILMCKFLYSIHVVVVLFKGNIDKYLVCYVLTFWVLEMRNQENGSHISLQTKIIEIKDISWRKEVTKFHNITFIHQYTNWFKFYYIYVIIIITYIYISSTIHISVL